MYNEKYGFLINVTNIILYRTLPYAKILPPSCFDVDGMVLKPQLRTALQVLGYQMYEEEFDKVWDR